MARVPRAACEQPRQHERSRPASRGGPASSPCVDPHSRREPSMSKRRVRDRASAPSPVWRRTRREVTARTISTWNAPAGYQYDDRHPLSVNAWSAQPAPARDYLHSMADASVSTQLLSGNPLLALPALFLGGVLTSLTPCVYPMIPITAAIVGGQTAGEGTPSRLRPVLLTLTYVVGLALVYSSLGVFAGITGTIFGSVSTNPWLYFVMANVLIVAALSMLDVLPVRLPQGLLMRASSLGTPGRFSGAFGMGAMSGLVAAPCSAPVMAAVLTWATPTKSAAAGFVYLLPV